MDRREIRELVALGKFDAPTRRILTTPKAELVKRAPAKTKRKGK